MKYTVKRLLRRKLITLYQNTGIDKFLIRLGLFDNRINRVIDSLGKDSILDRDTLLKDIKTSYYKYLTTPEEYFFYKFENQPDSYKSTFLSDKARIRALVKNDSEKLFIEILSDKWKFYQSARQYFKRAMMKVSNKSLYSDFEHFILRNPSIFVKPLSSSYGQGAHILENVNSTEIPQLFKQYRESGEWIFESKIIQSTKMSIWNSSSVNTVRVPCFLITGNFSILNPFIRTGREGAIIDNAGGGGIFACIDEESGKINSNGADEHNNVYSNHPDSGVKFIGWQIPYWSELIRLAEEIFYKCFPSHHYIGFDFALTEEGWILIEGNWGQFVGQIASKKGIKKEFEQLFNK